MVVIETTAGFTWVTRLVKSGRTWPPVGLLPGGLTGAPGVRLGGGEAGVADGKSAERGAGHQDGGQRGAAPQPAGGLGGLNE